MDPSWLGLRVTRWLLALSVVVWVLAVIPGASGSTPPRTGFARLVHSCPPPEAGRATCFAVVRRPVAATASGSAGVHPYVAGAGAADAGPAGGLTPEQLASAYSYDPAGGAGQTVAIVDAYDDPKIEEDLEVFDDHYGLGECTKADGCFRKVNQEGSEVPADLPAQDETGWSQEISLDVEMVRAACRGCKILLVEADNELDTNLAAAEDEAVALGATEVSNSYGGLEAGMTSGQQAAYNHPGVVITAAAGDYGYDNWNYLLDGVVPPAMPNTPASLPSVVSVGGTSLQLHENGTRASETVWNDDGFYDKNELGAGYVTGGGCSTIFTAQPWQQDASGFAATGCGDKRLSVDVSADGDPLTGFDIYDNFDYCKPGTECEEEVKAAIERYGGWQTFGGTSVGAPLIASLYALAGGSNGVEYPALALYGHLGESAALYDVTEGGNGLCDGVPELGCGHPDAYDAIVEGYALDVDCEYTTACDAAPGYDGPSGVGTPNGLDAFKPVLPTAAITPPSSAVAEVPASFSAAGSSDRYPGGSIASYSWSWGDGTPNGSGTSPTHTFAKPGAYTVSLTVTDSYGLTSTATTALVTVGARPPGEVEKGQAEQGGAQKQTEEAVKKRQEEEAARGGVLGVKEAAPYAKIASAWLQASSSGLVNVKISCPAGEKRCAGIVTLRTLDAVKSSIAGAANAKAVTLTLATGPFTVDGGKVVTVVLHLSARARILLGRSRTLRVVVTIVAHNPAGATHTGQTIVTLRAPKPGHGKG
jgi:PKD domain